MMGRRGGARTAAIFAACTPLERALTQEGAGVSATMIARPTSELQGVISWDGLYATEIYTPPAKDCVEEAYGQDDL